ncbi:hypothetical protein BC833DRAFT_150802 [Globomyces pollinis-pini]|nr:hypothetical protein BC833DRAFT_150802 [Globomyces pollinis-pini]
MLTDNVFELKRIGIEMMIDWTVWQPSILFTMNNLWNILFIIGAIAHCILCIVMIPLEGNVTGVKAIFAFETIMNLNTIISIFVRAQMILAATSGSFCSIAIGWAMLKTGGANVGVLAADHQRFYELFKLLQVTKQNRIRLFCVGGILLFIIVGLEGIILQQTLRDGLPSIYPFESTISIPTTIIPNDRNYLFSDVMGQPISYTGIGAGIGLKSLTDVSLRIDNKTNNVLPRIGPEPVPLVRCSSSATDCQSEFSMPMDLSIDCQQTTTKSTATDDSGTFVESMLGNSAPPTTTWIITKSNQDINVTHTCTITAGKSIWFDNRNGTMQKKSFESYTKVTEVE